MWDPKIVGGAPPDYTHRQPCPPPHSALADVIALRKTTALLLDAPPKKYVCARR